MRVSFDWTREDEIEARSQRLGGRRVARFLFFSNTGGSGVHFRVRVALITIFAGIICAGVMGFALVPSGGPSARLQTAALFIAVAAVPLALIVVIVAGQHWVESRDAARLRAFLATLPRSRAVEAEVLRQGVRVTSLGETGPDSALIAWGEVRDLKRTADYLMFRLLPSGLVVVPRRALAQGSAEAKFLEAVSRLSGGSVRVRGRFRRWKPPKS